MKILILYDSQDIIENIGTVSFNSSDRIYLYPLTSRSSITVRLCGEMAHKVSGVEVLETGQLLNLAADRIRDAYIKFIADIPDKIKRKGKNLKELFAIDNYATLWWFSLVSEKSTFKSSAFNNLAQIDSIVNTVENSKIEKIVCCCKNTNLCEALASYALKKSVILYALQDKKHEVNVFNTYTVSIFYLFRHAFRVFLRIYKIKKAMYFAKRAVSGSESDLMIITPYPHIDVALAQKEGVFNNKFYPFLQEELEKKKQHIIWVCMYVENNNISFDEALRHVRSFIKNGVTVFFLEEFNSVFAQARALFIMLRSGFRYLKLEKDIRELHDFGNYNFYPLFREDWRLSFMNHIGYEGILHYNSFRSLLKQSKAKRCLHLCEMQAWEKSLEAAKKSLRSNMSLFAYQHGAMPKMYLSYFNHPNEMKMNGVYAWRGPDKIICNGQIPYSYLKESGWPLDRIELAEAIRYNHLKGFLKSSLPHKKNIILLVLSLNLRESSSLLTVTWEAFKDFKNTEIWLRPHPFMRIDKVFELSKIPKESLLFSIKNEPLEGLLREARIVIVGESSVSFEALAQGCEVLIVNTCEWINMSPLRDIKSGAVIYINSILDLRNKVNDIFQKPYNREYFFQEAKKVIGQCFYLNENTDVPERFLEVLEGSGL